MKRQKANFNDIINQNIEYHATQRVKNKDGATGTGFILDKPLNDTQLKYFKQFKNIFFGTCHYRYAPQIKYNSIILFDKCLKSEV